MIEAGFRKRRSGSQEAALALFARKSEAALALFARKSEAALPALRT
jgi:hypothetical protein